MACRSAVELRSVRQHIAPQPHVLLGSAKLAHSRRVAVDGLRWGCRLRRGDARRPAATQERPVAFVSISDVMRRNGLTEITETFESRPSPERQKYATLAHGAQFIEVKVDPTWGPSASRAPSR